MPFMIANEPRHQHKAGLPIHQTIAVLVLLLTIYPYLLHVNGICYSVAAVSADDIALKHKSIDRFDIIEANDIIWTKSLFTRGTRDQSLTNELDAMTPPADSLTKRIEFSSLGRKFNIILERPLHLVTEDFTITSVKSDGKETLVPYSRGDFHILDGYLHDDKTSSVSVSFGTNDKLITAQIKTGADIIMVEPSYMHQNGIEPISSKKRTSFEQVSARLYNDTMIVYNLRDHKQFQDADGTNSNQFKPKELCASVDLSEYSDISVTLRTNITRPNSETDDIFRIYNPRNYVTSRSKRGIEYLSHDQSREKTRCTLHLVADFLFYKHIGRSDLQTTINYLLSLVNRVNKIYLPTVWETGDDIGNNFSNIGFTVQNITIHQEYTQQTSDEIHYNMQIDKIWDAREFLDNFSKYSPPRHYCLAHLLTYRQFKTPVLGLAYVASTRYGTIGGICSPTQQKGDFFYKHNTGISTSKGISGETLITRQADLVVAHELGHNLGAEHDSNECRPSPSEGGAYLMHPFAVMGFEKNNRFLSSCSRLSIGRVLKRKAPACFVGVVDHVCGNGIVEDDEECDGGDIGHAHRDSCCDSSCRLTPGSQCSDRHSWCCSKCHVMPAGVSCRPPEEYNCKQASHCDGRSAECPAAPPVDDNQVCVGRGLCRSGECIPFCESKELHSCLCTSPNNACKLCCKTSLNSSCVPYDESAPFLPDGLLCYRGICEKGRCEQPIQDVVERLWDVVEDINFTTFVKFLRDNIILVVLITSIPIWCIFSHYINEFDRRIKAEVMMAIKNNSRRRGSFNRSPFLPRIFVGDDLSSSLSVDDNQTEA